MGLLLGQKSDVSWEWRMVQNLKRTWLVSSKLIWGIWWILTRALKNLKNLNFNELFLTKAYNVWAKKSTEELFLIALEIDDKFEGKLTCIYYNDPKNLPNFHQSTFESLKFETFLGQRSYVSWEWTMVQNLKRTWLVSSKLIWGIWWIFTRALENLKNLNFNELLLTKVYNV